MEGSLSRGVIDADDMRIPDHSLVNPFETLGDPLVNVPVFRASLILGHP